MSLPSVLTSLMHPFFFQPLISSVFESVSQFQSNMNVFCVFSHCRNWPTLKHTPLDSSALVCRATNSRTDWSTSCPSSPAVCVCSQSEAWRGQTTLTPASSTDTGMWIKVCNSNSVNSTSCHFNSTSCGAANLIQTHSWSEREPDLKFRI